MDVSIERRLNGRRSAVAQHVDHEPHLSVQPVLAHESLWLDSGSIPVRLLGDMSPLFTERANGELVADVTDHASYFDASGVRQTAAIADGGTGVIEKQVRAQLARGRYGEFVSVKHIIHENIGLQTAMLYRPLLEYRVQGQFTSVADHEWHLDYYAGVLTWKKAVLDAELYLSFYRYAGRIGATAHMLNPSSDTLSEGSVNRFMKKDVVQQWAGEVVAHLDTDAIPEGAKNRYAQSRETVESWTEAQLAALTTDRIPEGAINRYAQSRQTIEGWTEAQLAALTTDHVPEGEHNKYAESREVIQGWTDARLQQLTTDDIPEGTTNFYGNASLAPVHTFVTAVTDVGDGQARAPQKWAAEETGVYEGNASIHGGSVTCVDHVAIGGPACSCPLSVNAPDGEPHIALIPGRANPVYLTARNDGALFSHLVAADTMRVERLYAMGLDNAYAGLQRTGDIIGARHIEAASLQVRGKRLCTYEADCVDVRCTRIYAVDGELLGALGTAGQCSSIHIWTAEAGTVSVVAQIGDSSRSVALTLNPADYLLTIDGGGVKVASKASTRFLAFENATEGAL